MADGAVSINSAAAAVAAAPAPTATTSVPPVVANDAHAEAAGAAGKDVLVLKNELEDSSSFYLRSHKDNPVAWQKWNSKSIELARKHERLIFLSIGYSACHWCHVMERESFSSPEVASVLNDSFIPIKVDRESRPDIDDIYMSYVTATTGSGGWPLNVFLTPSLQPVFGGTYWPGLSSTTATPASSVENEDKPLTFLNVLRKMEEIWRTERDRCLQSAADITKQLQAFASEGVYAHNSIQVRGQEDADQALEPLELDLLDDALDHFVSRYDPVHGGFSPSAQAPKFPTPSNLTFLLRIGASITRPSTHTRFGFPAPIPEIIGQESCTTAASMALHTLLAMSRSGLRDHLGHGFHRYSVTQDWNLPHFEKMTCDNAQLLSAYCDAWALGRNPEILGTIYDLVEYFTDASSPIVNKEGGWYSSEDADSTSTPSATAIEERKEGAYYVWTLKEFVTVLGEQNASIVARHFGVQSDGNIPARHDVNDDFISQNVLHISATPSVLAKEFGLKEDEIVRVIKESRTILREYRETKRGRPIVDDKLIVSWNGLVILALARAANTLIAIDEERASRCKKAAIAAVQFIKTSLFDKTSQRLTRVLGHVPHGSTTSANQHVAFLDDYAYLIQGLIKLYDITMDQTHLEFAFILQDTLDRHFYAGSTGGYFQAPRSEFQRDDGVRSPPVTMSSPPIPIISTGLTSDTQPTVETEDDLGTVDRKLAVEQVRQGLSGTDHDGSDRILNLKPGTDDSLPSANGVEAQNMLYLASYASSIHVNESNSTNTQSLLSSGSGVIATTKSQDLQHRAKKTIDAFAPEIIQYPFLYVTLLGAIVLDIVGVKSLLIPKSLSESENEAKGLRGFGRTLVRLNSEGIGEVMICTKQGVCRPLKEGELDGELEDIESGIGGVDIVDGRTKEDREAQARAEDAQRRRSTSVSVVNSPPALSPLGGSTVPTTNASQMPRLPTPAPSGDSIEHA